MSMNRIPSLFAALALAGLAACGGGEGEAGAPPVPDRASGHARKAPGKQGCTMLCTHRVGAGGPPPLHSGAA